jgi:hypothetical protein
MQIQEEENRETFFKHNFDGFAGHIVGIFTRKLCDSAS